MKHYKRPLVFIVIALATVTFAMWRLRSNEPFLGAEPRKGFDRQRVSYAKPALQPTVTVEFPELKFSATNHDVIEDSKRHEFALEDVVEFRGTVGYDDPKDPPIGVDIEIFEPTNDGRRKYGSAGGRGCKIEVKQSHYSFNVPMPEKPGKYTYELRCAHPSNLAKGKLLQRGQLFVRAFK